MLFLNFLYSMFKHKFLCRNKQLKAFTLGMWRRKQNGFRLQTRGHERGLDAVHQVRTGRGLGCVPRLDRRKGHRRQYQPGKKQGPVQEAPQKGRGEPPLLVWVQIRRWKRRKRWDLFVFHLFKFDFDHLFCCVQSWMPRASSIVSRSTKDNRNCHLHCRATSYNCLKTFTLAKETKFSSVSFETLTETFYL